MARESLTLMLMCRSLNALWSHLERAHPNASKAELEFAMADVLRRMETVDRALGKEWMRWFPPRSHRRGSAQQSA